MIEAPKQEESLKTTFEHTFVIDNAIARKVAVAGEFNGWKPTIFLEKTGSTWKSTVSLPIDSRSQYQYKFIVNDTEWVTNPDAPKAYDSKGKENNCVPVPGKGMSMSNSVSTSSASTEKVYEDIRYPRMILNKVHEECTRNNAEIFMH
jgi:1,4-alpha-glucan branching enzyme